MTDTPLRDVFDERVKNIGATDVEEQLMWTMFLLGICAFFTITNEAVKKDDLDRTKHKIKIEIENALG